MSSAPFYPSTRLRVPIARVAAAQAALDPVLVVPRGGQEQR
jgi:hypothetical protein